MRIPASDDAAAGAPRRRLLSSLLSLPRRLAFLSYWRLAFLAVAIAYAVPLASSAYDRFNRVSQQARLRLIQEHRLWEVQQEFKGRPEIWARVASRILNDRQLLMRVAAKYGAQSEQIELEYRRDLAIARAEVVLGALTLWAGPLGAVYAIAWVYGRRKRPPPPKVQPASTLDPRYRPPDPR